MINNDGDRNLQYVLKPFEFRMLHAEVKVFSLLYQKDFH